MHKCLFLFYVFNLIVMRKIIFFIFFIPAFSVLAQGDTAAVSPWKLDGFLSQQLNQISFTNWAAGGENSFSTTSIGVITANYSKENNSWENKLDLAYGVIKIQNNPLRKNEDKIDFLSKYGRKVSEKLNLAGLVNFRSQFADGYKYPNDVDIVSTFLAPGYLLAALGIDYKPVEFLSIFFSPATGKFTFVLDETLSEIGAFGVTPGEKVNPEFGAMATLTFNKEVFENVRLRSRLELFNNITDSDKRNRKNTDVNWETGVNMKVNRFITASVGFHLMYDHDIPISIYETINNEQVLVGTGPRTQFKQLFGIGLSYAF